MENSRTTLDSRLPRHWWLWHLLSAGLLLLAPSTLWLGEPIWAVSPERLFLILGFPIAYVAAALLVSARILLDGRRRPSFPLSAAAASLGCLFLTVLVLTPWYSRGLLLAGSMGVMILLALPVFLSRIPAAAAATLGLLVLGSLGVGVVGSARSGLSDFASDVVGTSPVGDVQRGDALEGESIFTSLHTLQARYFQPLGATVSGGGLDRVGDDFYLVTGEGEFFRFAYPEDDLALEPLSLRVPLNQDEFMADLEMDVNRRWFRVFGLLTQDLGDEVRFVVSGHHWRAAEACFTIRFYETVLEKSLLGEEGLGTAPWQVLHETRPCLPIKDRGFPFAGVEAGGRIEALGDSALLVTVGDHEFDGWNADRMLAQDPESDYGKTLLIPLDAGEVRIFTSGHRNPQGLLVAPDGRIWLSEHGPEGGDELNLLTEGANFGWPLQTHGTEYGDVTWPVAREAGDEGEFRSPVFSWTPAIGPSNLMVVDREAFPRWRGDLLLASLRGNALFRIRLQGDQVAYVEPIPLDRRIRDMAETADGRIVLWGDDGWFIALEETESEEQASLIRSCLACHVIGGTGQPVGPELTDVIGREIASVPGYPYSSALRALEGAWTDARLDAFLRDPAAFAPGNNMAVPRVEGEEERRVIIEYLRRAEARLRP
jgi:aldose sugar dehydrogenase